MPLPPLLRFAPSPNGYLHLGHAYSALITNRWASRMGGSWILRIEDIDISRSKPELIDAIFEDLAWLGLNWPTPVLHQSSRFNAYKSAIKKLKNMGLLYPCFCSRKTIQDLAVNETDPDGAPLYPGTCKHLSADDIKHRQLRGETVQYRLNMEMAMMLAGVLTYSIAQPAPFDRPKIKYANPLKWGDIVLVRKDTPTSYHLSVVLDDAFQKITHVTRGRDLEQATDIHVLLQFLLNLPTPTYTFHKLILDEDKAKLAKSKSSKSLRDLRNEGATSKDIRAQLGF